eukprot:CAMPEP_0119429058 /NCGR_PEP_ID=MMETSP1335-20130426/41539_1 /TAXON_ID=259385 /ORGANISM="Chrysoculter rhomboideus, Strain RCC1486" /LENGTH=85 /DNA_ID=CAMNT_0007454763 /DNA_START=52 /DNA_END=306 /DNA_ORIENTATION=-
MACNVRLQFWSKRACLGLGDHSPLVGCDGRPGDEAATGEEVRARARNRRRPDDQAVTHCRELEHVLFSGAAPLWRCEGRVRLVLA